MLANAGLDSLCSAAWLLVADVTREYPNIRAGRVCVSGMHEVGKQLLNGVFGAGPHALQHRQP